MYTAASYLQTKYWHLQNVFPVGLLSDNLCQYLRYIVHIYIYIYICVCVLYQNCILLKDSRTSPCIFNWKDFVSKPIGTGVSLHGATSKRDSMWHSPVFTCIRANRIPVKRIKEQLSDTSKCMWIFTSHWAHRPLHLIKFIMGIITDIIISADDRKQTSLTSGISS